ncbi:hypothetical protein DICVIV_12196 [Dictyocaulus viviparus]|uniref:Uncharacterized protein n=1 Tax=Dictyocaulus viviparus TaxID=29172 RepID=A0A0D8XDV0_DICVI|nr:hypothetical protein DICVIV_12196 [Dictyocaulus viviparus]
MKKIYSSTQYSPPPSEKDTSDPEIMSSTTRSNPVLDKIKGIEDEDNPKEMVHTEDAIVQTDNSYLRIARRLDNYRSMSTMHCLPVFAAVPLQLNNITPFNTDRLLHQNKQNYGMSNVDEKSQVTNYHPNDVTKIVNFQSQTSFDQKLKPFQKDELSVLLEEHHNGNENA